MEKRYRLKENITVPVTADVDFFEQVKFMIATAEEFIAEQASRIDYVRMEVDDTFAYEFKKDWLEEIPAEPMSAEEWLKKHKDYNKSWGPYTGPEMIRAFEAGVIENEKKHRLQQSYAEWVAENPMPRNCRATEHGWQAHAKATNTEA